MKKEYTKKQHIIFTVIKIAAAISLIIPIWILYFLLLCSVRYSIFQAFLYPSLLTIAVAFLALLIWHKKTRKALLWSTLAMGIVTTIAVGIAGGRELYLDSIRLIDNSNINTDEYLPFKEDSKIARLDHEASLRFKITDKLPIVDGAAALFPMYSAFVNATYPSNIPNLNAENGPFWYTNTIGSYGALAFKERDIVFGVDPDAYKEHFYTPDAEWPNEHAVPYSDIEKVAMGREGFVFFTNVKNPVNSLTEDQLRGIYSGEITNWKEVGGDNEKVRPYSRNYGSGSYVGLQKFMGDKEIIRGETVVEYDLMAGIINAIADYENHPGAIGYSYYTYASKLKANNNIKILAVNGIDPSLETISNQTYPIVDSFYMSYNKTCLTSEMTRLMNWVLSSEGQELVLKSGYAPVNS